MIMQAWKDYQEKNKDRFLDELLELLRIPSVSANSDHKEDMRKCAEKVQQRLLEAGGIKDVVISAVVYRETLTFEHAQRLHQQWRARFPDRPGRWTEPVFGGRRESDGGGLLARLKNVDREMLRLRKRRRAPRRFRHADQ